MKIFDYSPEIQEQINSGRFLGAVRNMPEGLYHSAKSYINSSSLKHLIEGTPRKCRLSIDSPVKKTSDMELGTAIHCAILEPKRFEKEYARNIEGDGRSAEVKAAKAKLIAEGKKVLHPEDYDAITSILKNIEAKASVQVFLKDQSERELSLFWTDATTGVSCRARIDLLHSAGVLLDIKSTDSAHEKTFPKYEMKKWAMIFQTSFYRMGLRALGRETMGCTILAVEKKSPYDCNTFDIRITDLDAGEAQARRVLKTYAECKAANRWPGYRDEIITAQLPDNYFETELSL